MRLGEGQTFKVVAESGLNSPGMKRRRKVASIIVSLLIVGGVTYNQNDAVRTAVDSFCSRALELIKNWEPPDSIRIG